MDLKTFNSLFLPKIWHTIKKTNGVSDSLSVGQKPSLVGSLRNHRGVDVRMGMDVFYGCREDVVI